MNDTIWAAIALFAALAPLGVTKGFSSLTEGKPFPQPPLLAVAAAALGFVAVAIAVVASDSILDWLNLSPPNFQLAAGCVMLPVALRLLYAGETMNLHASQSPSAYLLLAPLLVGPVPFVTAVYFGGRYGTSTALVGAAVAIIIAAVILAQSPWLMRRIGEAGGSWMGRCSGALLAVIAVKLIVDGINSL